jgi:Cu/Zn superoxide dismutase
MTFSSSPYYNEALLPLYYAPMGRRATALMLWHDNDDGRQQPAAGGTVTAGSVAACGSID